MTEEQLKKIEAEVKQHGYAEVGRYVPDLIADTRRLRQLTLRVLAVFQKLRKELEEILEGG